MPGITITAPGEETEFIEFFRGLIGKKNVFAHFDDHAEATGPNGSFLRRLPRFASIDYTVLQATVWGGGCAEETTIQFMVDEATLRFFQEGLQISSWRPLRDVKVIKGSVTVMPTKCWPSDPEEQGWVIAGGEKKDTTAFASSYASKKKYDQCRSLPLEGGEMVSLRYRAKEPVVLPLIKVSLYYKGVFDEGGNLSDTRDPVNIKTYAQLDAWKAPPFPGCTVDALGNILNSNKKVQAITADYEELLHDVVGYIPVSVGECRRAAGERWGWPAERVLLRHLSGEALTRDGLLFYGETMLVASRAPWCVSSSVRIPVPSGAAAAAASAAAAAAAEAAEATRLLLGTDGDGGNSAAEGAANSAEKRVDIVAQIATSCDKGTLAALKRHLVAPVGVPMDAFNAWAWDAAEEAEGSAQDEEPRPPPRLLQNGDTLDVPPVPAVRFLLRPEMFRLLVELRHREVLWRASKAGQRTLARGYLGPAEKDVGFAAARQLFGGILDVQEGDLRLRFDWSQGDPCRWQAALRGPRGSCYEGGFFWILVSLDGWPRQMPQARFLTPVHHCNVREDGVLLESSLGLGAEEWGVSNTVFDFLAAVLERLSCPDPWLKPAARPELAAQLKADRAAYDLAARELTRRHALSREPPPPTT